MSQTSGFGSSVTGRLDRPGTTPEQTSSGSLMDKASDAASAVAGKARDLASSVADTAGDVASSVAQRTQEVASSVAESAGSAACAVGRQAQDWAEDLETFVRRYPVPCLLGCLGLGFLVARLVRR